MLEKLKGYRFPWKLIYHGYELDILIQKRKNKTAAIRFLKRILGSNPEPRVIITDKLNSYTKPIKPTLKT